MSITKRYTLDELRTLMEQKDEFNPVFGNNVKRDNEKNNKKHVEKILNDTERASGKKTSRKENKTGDNVDDYNKTTLDVDFDRKPGEEYINRTEQLSKYGTPHKLTADEKDVNKNGGLDYSGNEKVYAQQKEKSEEMSKTEEELKTSGLKASKQDPDKFKTNTIFKESKTMKRLHFKNTRFLSEAQIIKKVPEAYKTDGNRFLMRDNTGTDYLVECRVDNEFNHTTINVLNRINKNELNEQLNRMRLLSGYNSSDYFSGTNSESRKLEEGKVSEMLDLLKKMETNRK